MARRALITGITGQDGSYLAELLLDLGYEVIGMVRRSSTVNYERIAHIQDRITFVPGDLLDQISMIHILQEHRPSEVYNLAAQSFVQTSFGQPVLTGETTGLGVTRVLDAIRIVDPDIRFYQASSSEMFGKVQAVPQTEDTPFYPRSPYGVAFSHVGLNWEDHVTTDEKFFRPAEVDLLVGDASKAKADLGWEPSVRFEGLVRMMVDADIELLPGRLESITPRGAPPRPPADATTRAGRTASARAGSRASSRWRPATSTGPPAGPAARRGAGGR